MTLWHNLVLAVIQGLTEFLPVSSSAHLVIIPVLFGWENNSIDFEIAIHLGTLCAVLIYFRKHILTLCNPFNALTQKLIVATIPACLIGLIAKPFIETYARDPAISPLIIAYSTIFFGLILGVAQFRENNKVQNFNEISFYHALIIGLAQCCALIPGASRSGVTISAALLLGIDRKTAVEFAFLISIPVIALSSLLIGYEIIKTGTQNSMNYETYLFSFITSAVVGTLAIHSLIKLLKSVGMYPFVIYRLFLGSILLYLFS